MATLTEVKSIDQHEKVGLREKVAYGLGDAASSTFWKMFSMYMLFFYTDVFGISAAAVGTMFLVTRIWDAINDPLMGILSDKTTTRFGKFRPYLLLMAIPFGLVGILTFTTPDLSESNKIIYAYITYSLMMMVYTGINVPYSSLLGVITSNPKERTSLASYRFIFAFAGSILVLATAEPLVKFFEESNTPQVAWQSTMTVFAIFTTALFFLTFLGTKERVKPKKQKTNTLQDLKNLSKNKEWFIMLGAGISCLIFNSIRDGVSIYYFKYFIASESNLEFFGLSLTLSSLFLVVGQLSNLVGVVISASVANKMGKRNTFMMAMVSAAILSFMFYLLSSDQLVLIYILQGGISLFAGMVFPLMWSMYADIADYSEYKTGRRSTGLIFSSSSMSQKMGWTLGGALSGWLLSYFGFEANTTASQETINGLKMMLSIIPAIGAILSVIFLTRYKLTESFMTDVQKSLREENER
ncbi:MFS transporter [Flammeovirga sp. SubArs3]|uniref:MFS transporter n=1 Tax=Flammeovirga sp. SubArs3 TaxID=2995316 RepID=UPI00248B7787|nr:MFS transporter [Flammeovirga sp. SubArs3]